MADLSGWSAPELAKRLLDELAQIMRRLPLQEGADEMIEAEANEILYSYALRVEVMLEEKSASVKGRPREHMADDIVLQAAVAYEHLTDKFAKRGYHPGKHKPQGEFFEFVTEIFKALGIEASPDVANQRLQTDLRLRGKEPNKNHKPGNTHHMTRGPPRAHTWAWSNGVNRHVPRTRKKAADPSKLHPF
jgi:hypothetical protein